MPNGLSAGSPRCLRAVWLCPASTKPNGLPAGSPRAQWFGLEFGFGITWGCFCPAQPDQLGSRLCWPGPRAARTRPIGFLTSNTVQTIAGQWVIQWHLLMGALKSSLVPDQWKLQSIINLIQFCVLLSFLPGSALYVIVARNLNISGQLDEKDKEKLTYFILHAIYQFLWLIFLIVDEKTE